MNISPDCVAEAQLAASRSARKHAMRLFPPVWAQRILFEPYEAFESANSSKRADFWKKNSWILHHDNEPSHKTIIVNEFLAKNSTNIIEKPPYSPDMTPADIFLFQKLKLPLQGTRFQSIEDVKENSWRELKSIPENVFKKCFDNWIIR